MAELEVAKQVASSKASRIIVSSSGQKIVKAADPYPSRAIPLRALEEDDYVEAVSALIERDFFPDLPHLRARYELMQARLRGDNALAKALEKKLLELPRPTPGGTPRAAATPRASPQTPINIDGGAAAARLSAWERDDGAESVASANAGSVTNCRQVLLRLISGREVLVDLSTVRLDDFQKAFTSEDNASFEAVLEKDRERRRQKEWWVEGSEEKHNTKCEALKDQIREARSTNEIMTCEFQARNTLYFKPQGEIGDLIEKPLVESRNTRFTSQEQSDLDETLIAAIAARHTRETGQQFSEVLAKMVKDGTFSVAALHSHGTVRAVGGRLQTPLGQGASYPMVNTPALLPGENGFSPLMTFGKIASTPRALDEETGPTFRVQEESARDRAAEKLAKGAVQKQKEWRQNSKKERLKALGLTPSASPVGSARPTPASVASKVTPMTPIGQLLHRAQRMAQRGGRLKIASSQRTTPTPSEREVKRQRTSRTPVPSASIPSSLMADLL